MTPETHNVRPRLDDVARTAGVSVPTVSRVLNGKSGASPETRQAVLTAMDSLGYERPARTAGRSKGQIGVVVPDLVNPIFPAFAGAIAALLAPNDYIPALCTLPGGGITEDEYVALMLDQGISGIIFVCAAHSDGRAGVDRYRRLRGRVPFVLVNGARAEIDAPSISNDDATAIRTAVRHLATQGHQRVGFATGSDRFIPSRRKMEGFRSGLADFLGENADLHVATSMFTIEGGQSAANELIDSGHTGIVCASDIMALGAMRAAQTRGLRVPEDISVVGFDDSPLMAFTNPPLTTLRQNIAAMAEAAVHALVTELAGDRVTRTDILFQADLVVRGSTGAGPAVRGSS
ncbi:DNA-binding LacI/PurR family transcriptional regulator [Arthrobacter sp. CAN_A212]|uniref:LacI family DNA-binding transcriptional regulator n=1 Tax=unclassified Arthrobacter TaxID=235627 RepID=UPI0018C9BFFF|nr:LacI family DNA-binding transcriptional regulator [Arthrobacter sp. CAN_C5]MBP2216705.1 DNA-binding LacI/PurR family transcriptional regulator [Arthrobacter sp. CAN_C5]